MSRRDHTLAVTVGPWGGFGVSGKWKVGWRVNLGYAAVTYYAADTTDVLDAWLKASGC